MADQPKSESRMVCFCHTVRLEQLLAAIRDGALTLKQLQERTKASTGCGGCEWDVLEVLETELRGCRKRE